MSEQAKSQGVEHRLTELERLLALVTETQKLLIAMMRERRLLSQSDTLPIEETGKAGS